MTTHPTSAARARIDDPEGLGALVRSIREESGLSQENLGALIGVSQRYISELETGKPKIFDARFVNLLRKLGIKLFAERG